MKGRVSEKVMLKEGWPVIRGYHSSSVQAISCPVRYIASIQMSGVNVTVGNTGGRPTDVGRLQQ